MVFRFAHLIAILIGAALWVALWWLGAMAWLAWKGY